MHDQTFEVNQSSNKSWLALLLGCGCAAFLALTVIVAVCAYLIYPKVSQQLAMTSEAEAASLKKFDQAMPADAKAAFTRRPKSTPTIPFDQVVETYEEFPVPDADKKLPLGWANVYLAKFGGHLKSYSSNEAPGTRMSVRAYLPVDLPNDAKIPCVLLAPAGSNLLTGKDCDDYEYTDEIKPYVTAGMAVVHYSLDGSLDKISARGKERAVPGQSAIFCKAHGGVINGQRAIDFVLKNFDQIDSRKLYCAGHSSAATLSLQLASTDPRISKCVAYAPAPSLEKRFADLKADDLYVALPRLELYVKQWSPDNRIPKFHCPVFIFHALDDSNTPYPDTKAFYDQLRAAGKKAKLVTAKRGGHYQAMIDEGIPAAIAWLK